MNASDPHTNRTTGEDSTVLSRSPPTRADARRDKLIEAARTLFAERGFHSTGVAQIAKASGVLVGQIYRDFANKEEIVAAIAARDLEVFLAEDELGRAIDAGDTVGVRAWIRQFVAGKVAKDRRLACEVMAEAMRNPRIATIFLAIQNRIRRSLARSLDSLAPGAERERERALTVEVILTIGGAIIHHGADGGAEIDPAVAERLTALVDREIDALIAR